MFYTYILKSKINCAYYIGSCKDLSVRLKKHNSGLVRSTKRYKPWEIVYFESFGKLSDSRFRETQIKSWKSRAPIDRLVETFQNKFVEDPR